jgi:hypothetical protein
MSVASKEQASKAIIVDESDDESSDRIVRKI